MMGIKGAIFDADGTLLDSMQVWASIGLDFLKNLGLPPERELIEVLNSRSGKDASKYLQDEYGISRAAIEAEDWRTKMPLERYLEEAVLKPGVIDVLETMRLRGIGMCVATATDRNLVEPVLRKCGILGFFGRVYTCGEERVNKRSPEIFVRAAEFLGYGVRDTLVVEDSLHAIRAAKGAGFPVAAVFDLSAADQRGEIEALCDYYFMSPLEMLEML